MILLVAGTIFHRRFPLFVGEMLPAPAGKMIEMMGRTIYPPCRPTTDFKSDFHRIVVIPSALKPLVVRSDEVVALA